MVTGNNETKKELLRRLTSLFHYENKKAFQFSFTKFVVVFTHQRCSNQKAKSLINDFMVNIESKKSLLEIKSDLRILIKDIKKL